MSVEDAIKNKINTDPSTLSRQQKRQMERSGKSFDRRTTFTKREVEDSNTVAYEYGKQLALKAAAEELGLGEKRLMRVGIRLARLEHETFVVPFEGAKN